MTAYDKHDDEPDDVDLFQLRQQMQTHTKKPAKPQGWWEWLLSKRPPPPLPWEQAREARIKQWIYEKRKYPAVRALLSEASLYALKADTGLKYHGERDEEKRRDGRGACKWPDPPVGGGEEYLGLWRKDQPHRAGVCVCVSVCVCVCVCVCGVCGVCVYTYTHMYVSSTMDGLLSRRASATG